MFLLPVEEPPTSEYLFISLNDKSIHRFINQSVNQSSTHSYSKIMNFLILIATALFTTLVSCDVRIPILPPPLLLPPHHTPIISISHKKIADYLFTNTKTNILNNRNAWPSPEESAMEVELVTAELQKVESVRLVER